MIPRGRLSISYFTLGKALMYCFTTKAQRKFVPLQARYGTSLFCLSARTALHLTLRSLNFAKGSAIMVTDINIPDMFAIFEAHNLACIPISLNKHTLGLNIEEMEAAFTSQTKAILVTHLFGAIMEMEEIITFANKHQLVIIEDCAQAFDCQYRGNAGSDVSLFSFGLIKTNTCLTGAMVCFNNDELFNQVNLLNEQLPQQPTRNYFNKILKGIAINLITTKWVYTLLYLITKASKKDFDNVLATFTKGFPGDNVMKKISFRPSDANLRLLHYRATNSDFAMVKKRKALAERILQRIPPHLQIGDQSASHSHWVVPVESADPEKLIDTLRAKGIDATARASSLISVNSFKGHLNQLCLENLVYLPIHKALIKEDFF